MPKIEQSSCTEDRIQHVLERCLCDLGVDTPDKQMWNSEDRRHTKKINALLYPIDEMIICLC